MITLQQITEEMGDIWIERMKERARHIYRGMKDSDLSRSEYVNSYVRHSYFCVQEAKTRSKKSPLEKSADFLGRMGL